MGGIPEGQQQPAAPAPGQKAEQKSDVPAAAPVDGANVPK
jgi:hypothetical protein